MPVPYIESSFARAVARSLLTPTAKCPSTVGPNETMSTPSARKEKGSIELLSWSSLLIVAGASLWITYVPGCDARSWLMTDWGALSR